MSIIDIFKGKENTENMVLDVPKAEQGLDIPKVIFEDLVLQVKVGQWLGVLSSQKLVDEFINCTFSSSDELIKVANIPTEQLEEIVTKFGYVLKLVGIDNAETCTLSQYDKDNFSFNCHFNNSGNDANISLKNKIFFEPGVIINYQNECKAYEYYKESKNKPIRLDLQYYTIKNPENGNSCFRGLSLGEIAFILQNGEYSFSINISRDRRKNPDIFSWDIFRLKNEEALQQYLLGLSFPFEINEVYKKICEISVDSITDYQSFELKVDRKLDGENNKTTDMVSIFYGQISKFIITKGGKTIEINGDGSWSYDSPKLTVSQNNKGNITYTLNSIPSVDLLNIASPLEKYNEVCKDVEQVRLLTKTILKSEKK